MKNYLEKLKISFIVVILPMISYLLLGPLEIYFGNKKDFQFEFTDFFGHFLIISLLACLFISAILALFPEKVNKVINAVILFFGVGSYIQNMFMNVKLSEIDGSPMDWSSLGKFPIINSIIWVIIFIIIIGVLVCFKKHYKEILIYTAAFLSIIQVVAVLSLVIKPSTEETIQQELQLVGNEQFSVAEKDNTIIFVLDTFGNTQFENVLEKYPDIINGIEDFTYYNNADCHYYCTFPSLTCAFTGNELDFETEDTNKWLKEAWESEKAVKFYDLLKKKDYTCNIYSNDIDYTYGNINNLYGKFDNIKPDEKIVNHKELLIKMGKMSVYKYVPYVLKPKFEIYNNQFDDIISFKASLEANVGNNEFIKALRERKLSINPSMKNSLIIQHLFGTHQPYIIDENANAVEESDVESVSKGLFVILNEYMEQLKDIGVYDSANIIITADHGSWFGGDTQPSFFVKKSGEKHDKMVTNTAPISLDDLQATILSFADIDYSDYGKSIFDWKENEERERTVYMRMNDDDYPNVEGSAFNVYYGYSYKKDKAELNEIISTQPAKIVPATPWK